MVKTKTLILVTKNMDEFKEQTSEGFNKHVTVYS